MEIHPITLVFAILLAYAAGMTLGWYWGRHKYSLVVEQVARTVGGKIDWMMLRSEGSSFATMSMPLPKSHWLLKDHENVPPMPWRMGLTNADRGIAEERFTAVAKYAIRASTMNGAEIDFDPDAMVRNFVVGAIGYYTWDGHSHADEAFEELQPTVDVRNVRPEVQVPVPGRPKNTQGSGSPEGQRPPQFGGGVPTRGEDNSAQRGPTPEEGAGEGQGPRPIRGA